MSAVPRRQVLRACAAATLLAAVRPPSQEPLEEPKYQPAAAALSPAARVFFFDPQHASAQDLAARLLPGWGTAIALGPEAWQQAASALPAGTQLMAGRTTYADFSWLAGLAHERRLAARFHAYVTFAPAGAAAGTLERRVLIEAGVRVSQLQRLSPQGCEGWLEALAPGGLAPSGVSGDAGRAGCTLHDWIFCSPGAAWRLSREQA